MKKLFKVSVLLMAAAGAALPLSAEEVSGDEAMSAVAGWVNVKAALGEDFTAQPANVREYPANDGKGKFYVVELEGGGFVVTSGDTELEPVIAYSKDGTWIDDVAQNPLLAMLPVDVAAALDSANATGTTGILPVAAASTGTTGILPVGGARLSASTATAGTAVVPVNGQDARSPSAKAAKWAEFIAAGTPKKGGVRLQAGSTTSNPGDLRVGKMLTTAWGQGRPSESRVAYNYYTPTVADNTNYRFYSGCVATAGGQIMYYHQWPQTSITLLKNYTQTFENGRVFTAEDGYQTTAGGAYNPWDNVPFGGTYNWAGMTSNNSTTRNESIGKLLRDIGISIYMNYSSSGSGAQSSCLCLRFTDQFGYANAVFKYELTEDEWTRAILSNLDAKLPVVVGVPGHAIVADGYGYQNGTLYVHFNLGWTGTYDAWYNPPDLTDAHSQFTSIGAIVYNIYPQGTPGCTIVSGRIKDASDALKANATVTAVNRTSGASITATTDSRGIYALFLPAGDYSIGTSDGSGSAAATNLTVAACVSTSLNNGTMELEAQGSYYPGTGNIADIPGVELKLAAVPVPVISPADGTAFYGPRRTVKIACADALAEIRYTTDGSEPTASSALYEGAFTVSATTTVKAKAFLFGESSGTATAALTKRAYYGVGGLYPDDKANHAAHWLDEREAMQEATGTWSNAVDYVDGKITFTEDNAFTMTEPSKGTKATIIAKVSFDTWCTEADADLGNVRAGVRAYTNGHFQAYALVDGAKRWGNLTGVTPAADTEYTVKLVLDNRRMTYTAAVVNGNSETPLVAAEGGAASFPFANQSNAGIKRVRICGEGKLESLEGMYKLFKGVLLEVR